jgi:hypothetical protein
MKRMARAAPLAIVLASMIGAILAAQGDLSGRWEPIPEASVLNLVETAVPNGVPPPPPPPRTLALTITQAGSVITMERHLAQPGQPGGGADVRASRYEIDGAPTISQNGALTLTTRATREGSVLVLTSEAVVDGRPFGTVRDRYSLVGDQLVVESTRTLPAGTIASRDVHRRVTR